MLIKTEDYLYDKAKLTSPKSAQGVPLLSLQGADGFADLPLGVQAFLARTLEAIDARARVEKAAKELKSTAGTAASSHPGGTSALNIASALAPPKVCDTQDAYRTAGLEKLPFVHQLETLEAALHSRKPFTFVDLTAKEVLPLWVFPEAV